MVSCNSLQPKNSLELYLLTNEFQRFFGSEISEKTVWNLYSFRCVEDAVTEASAEWFPTLTQGPHPLGWTNAPLIA